MTNPAISEEMVERFCTIYEKECNHRYDRDAIRAALSALPLPVEGVGAYKAENAKNGWSGRGLSFDGGCLNLGKDGSAEFVFNMDDCDPYYEEGKSLMLAKVPASEIEFLRDYLVNAFPVATPAAGPSAVAVSDDDVHKAWLTYWAKTMTAGERFNDTGSAERSFKAGAALSTLAPSAAASDPEETISPYEWLAQEFDRLAILRKMWTALEVAAMIRRHDIYRTSTLTSPSAEAAKPVADAEAHAEATRVFWEHPGGWKDSFDAALQAYSVALSQPQGGLREALAPFISDAAEIAPGIPDDTGFWMEGYETLGFADFTVGDLRKLALAGRAAG